MRAPTHRRGLVAALVLPAVLAVSACSGTADADEAPASGTTAPAEVTVVHAQGETTVATNPETVVVFDLGVLTTLDEWGIEVAGVPEITATSLPEDLTKYAGADYEKVGSLFEPDYDAVEALEPDLIIVAARSAAAYPELAEIAPTIDLSVDNTDFRASLEQRALDLASVFGKTDETTERIAAINADIETLSATAADAGKGLIVRIEAGEATAYGPGSRYGIIHDAFGVPAVADDFATDAAHGDAISFEFIQQSDPDILFVQDREAAAGDTTGPNASVVLDNELVNATSAAKNDKIVYLDLFTWYLAPSALSSVEAQIATVSEAVSAD